jgi:hypothetical protein
LSCGDAVTPPAKASFGRAWATATEGVGDLGLEESACAFTAFLAKQALCG